jgi:hypothetical protein
VGSKGWIGLPNKDKKARHLRTGTGGRHRLRNPSSGLIAVSAVLLAASAASSATVHASEPAEQAPTPTRSEAGAGGNTPPSASFPREIVDSHLASGRFVGGVPASATGSIPSTVLDAYHRAHERTNLVQPNCHIPLELLAAIGKVESGHARGGSVDATGRTLTPILGPVLAGGAFAAIGDTDDGVLDGDATWDRAVGPMQFIPSTWASWAADGNVDGKLDPHNVYDASLAAARYLCAANRDLGTPAGLDAAVLSYNHSTSYLSLVRSWMTVYHNGTVSVADIIGDNPSPQAAVAPPSSTAPVPVTVPVTPPVTTPPVTTPPVTTTPPTEPSDPTDPPTEPPVEPPTETPTEPPVGSPESPEPPEPPTAPPVEETEECGLVDAIGNLVGGLLGEDPICVHVLELSTAQGTATPMVATMPTAP